MSLLTNNIKLYLYINNAWVDYTDGLINCNIVRGIQSYEGPFSQPDVGQLTILTRNENLDPYNNSDVVYNLKIKITANDTPIFTGKIDGIDVKYKPKGLPPEITLTAIDYLGSMQRHILSNVFIKRRLQLWTPFSFIQDMQLYASTEMSDFVLGENYYDNTSNCSGSINSGQPAWSAFASMAITDSGIAYANKDNEFCYYKVDFDNANHPNIARPIKATFASDGSELSYKSINLNDGLEQLCNDFTVTQDTGIWSLDGTTFTTTINKNQFVNNPSTNIWGKVGKQITVKTQYPHDLMEGILQETSKPRREVYEISYNAGKNIDIAKDIDMLDNIYVDHQINESTTISRKYGVVGIRHQITLDSWETTYLLRNWNYLDTEFPKPIFNVTPTSGTTNTTFTFTLENYDVNDGYGITWYLGAGNYQYDQNVVTQTYASGNILNTWVEVENEYGWIRRSDEQQITVTAAPPYVDFTFTADPYLTSKIYFTEQASGETSLLWTFGDGTTSTASNPEKVYSSIGGTYNVTLQATNAYGTSTITKQVIIPAGNPLSIRYLAFGCILEDPALQYTVIPNQIFDIYAYDSNNVNLLENKNCIDIYNGNMWISDNKLGNNNSKPRPWIVDSSYDWPSVWTVSNPDILTNNSGPTPEGAYAVRFYQGSAQGYTFAFTYDLGAQYTDITQITAKVQMSSGTYNPPYYPLKVYGSPDNITWYRLGQFNFEERTSYLYDNTVPASLYGWPVTMTGEFGMPPQAPGLQVPFFDTGDRPMRFLRGTITNGTFKLGLLSPMGAPMGSNTTYKVNRTYFTGSPAVYLSGARINMNRTSGTVTSVSTGNSIPNGYVETYCAGGGAGAMSLTNFTGTFTVDLLESFNNIWGVQISTDLGGQAGDSIYWEHSIDGTNWEPLGTLTAATSNGTFVNSYLRNNVLAPITYGSTIISSTVGAP